ncbi:MAG: putative hydroxymethylpyrimidine transporter CytX, partial [Limosilactobacillus sp.]
IIVVFSTVTTTFMDAYSAGVSAQTIVPHWSGTRVAIAATVLGTAGALTLPMDNFSNFLYLIGSVFAPMIAIQITDYFILHVDRHRLNYSWRNLIIWLAGFALYRWLMTISWPLGSTVPTIVAVIILTWLVARLTDRKTLKQTS